MKHKSLPVLSKQDKWILFLPAIIVILLSVTLSLSNIVRYRDLEAGIRWMHWIGSILWLISFLYLANLKRKLGFNTDDILFSSVQLLIGIGLVTIWRLNSLFGLRQSLWIVLCSLIAGLLIKNQQFLDVFKKYKYLFLLLGLGLIILTFIFGTYPGGIGPKLWLGIQGIFFQPSELLKLILIFYLAAYFSGKPITTTNIFQYIFPTAILTFASITLLVFQRDFGTALIFLSIYLLTIFSVYGKRRILLISFLILLLLAVIGYFSIDLIRIRFNAWVYPWIDAQAGSYQIIQSIIAIAAGGILGTGSGLGYPNLVPLAHSDFIFSAIIEELGLVGGIGILCLLLVLLFKGFSISLKAKNRYHQYLAVGITSFLITQSILIIGGNIRLLPITGVTLPFISYGGSSLLVSYLSFAILMIVEKDQREKPLVESKPFKTVAVFFSICIITISLTLGWWGIVHADDIQQRSDNARNLIANLFVKRGEILDRNNIILAKSVGKPGEFSRLYTFPPLSNTLGFSHQKFGLSGIEAAFDAYLRGFRGYPSQDIWLSYLLYDQPPEGRSIRITVDSEIQQISDQLMQSVTGGMVLLDANNGEILAISTSPYFDANKADTNWENWQTDISSPLINRAAQSAYPVGGLISPLVLSYLESTDLNQGSELYSISYDGFDQNCRLSEDLSDDPLKKGCVTLALSLTEDSIPSEIFEHGPLASLLVDLDIGMDTAALPVPDFNHTWVNLLLGNETLRSNPLRVASAFLPLSNQGSSISPSLVSAVNTSDAGWVFIGQESERQVMSENKANEISSLLSVEEGNLWEISAVTKDTIGNYQWYVAGTKNLSEGKRNYVLAIALENASREKAIEIGSELLLQIIE